MILPASGLSALASPAAYTAPVDGENTVEVVQPTGLLTTPVEIPKVFANQLGVNARLGGVSPYSHPITCPPDAPEHRLELDVVAFSSGNSVCVQWKALACGVHNV